MSNKIKLNRQKGIRKRVTLKKVPKPTRIGFKYHLGDTAGCGYIRCIFPSLLLNNMVSKDLKVEAFYTNQYTPMPQAYATTTFAIFQRSATPDQLKMIQHFKQMRAQKKLNTSIIYEIDDNLFDIPDWNFAKPFYVEHKDTAEQILRNVDGIATSTEFLKKEYSKYNKNVVVTPNHLPRFMWGGAEFKPQENKKPRILYAGSMNHFSVKENENHGDMEQRFIKYILETTDKYEWHFVGGAPQEILKEARSTAKIKYHEWQNIMSLPYFLRSLNVDISLAPLESNTFNMSKSNIKSLEGTAIGVPMVYSDFGPYAGLPGAVKHTDEMIGRIEELATDVDKRQEQWYNQYEALKGQLYWEENDNLTKYINNYLRLVRMRL
jgi:hypothetical protein